MIMIELSPETKQLIFNYFAKQHDILLMSDEFNFIQNAINIQLQEHDNELIHKFIDWYNGKINLGLSRKEGITPNEAIQNKLQPESILGLFLRLIELNGKQTL